jgi:nitroreductase
MKFSIEETNKLIQNRRSIYPASYSGERVSDDIIEQMLENANWAPTHKLTEPWRFVVFCDEGIQSFANFQGDLYKKVAGDKYNVEKEKKMREKPLLCSHIIAICMKRHPVVPEVEEIAAVATAVQNMQLTATAHGVGCYWTTGGVTFYKGVNEHLELEKEDKLLGFLYIGMPKTDELPKAKRQPIEDKVRWVKK